ncbi:MAG TPA: HEAT repeat domain-containing protein [Desulfobacterales bacterium]|nr:HEAT repeat domain-containing protein [Desulfobacterales bacterium]
MTRIYAFKSIMLGLIIAQALSTLMVYLSNTELFDMVEAITRAGYLSVPNSNIMPILRTFKAAFFGGLFFTMTAGACLSVFAFAAAWIWDRILKRNPYLFVPFLMIWLWCILSVNSQGVSGIVTAQFFLVPAAVFGTALLQMPQPREHLRPDMMIHLIAFAVLLLMANAQTDARIFLKIRDNLLLSNPVGIKLNNFYYRYTLYPARAFKSYNQKLIRTCNLASIEDKSLARSLKKRLLANDYLIVSKEISVDLNIVKTGDHLVFRDKGKMILRTSPEEFLRNSRKVLKEFSEKSDRHIFFRWFIFFSLLTVPPLILYFSVYALFHTISGFFLSSLRASVSAGILCCMTGAVLLLPLHFGIEKDIKVADLPGILISDNWHHRVAALKMIWRKNIEIGNFPKHTRLLQSPHIPERYWLAKVLGKSRSPETYPQLLSLLDDANFNVVYSALSGLGRRGEKEVIGEILKQIKISDNWYVQWYAYKALRKLGWKQSYKL